MKSTADTIPAALAQASREFPNAEALCDGELRLSFAELHDQVRTMAGALIALDLEHGDRVAIWSPNTWHWVITALATHYIGATVIPINTRYTGAEATDILHRTQTRALVIVENFLNTDRLALLDPADLPALRTVIQIPIESPLATTQETYSFADIAVHQWSQLHSLAQPISPTQVEERAAAVAATDISDILFTSGTTGRSKGVLYTHKQSLATSADWARCGLLSTTDRYLIINPFFHSFGYKAGILACLQTGATIIPMLTFSAEGAMRMVQDHQITVLPGPPTIYQTILDSPQRSQFNLTSLRFAVTGATIVPITLIERMQTELDFDIVLTAYGLTESGGFGTMCQPQDDAKTVATTCGRPIADFELRISDSGEVLLRGPNVMLGYLDDIESTFNAIDSEGWLHTGDIGRLTSQGYLQITDRLKDMYICGGFNVYPAEVEQVLAQIPEIAEAAVIGVPQERLGEVGRAFIVKNPGNNLTETTVLNHCKNKLANYKVPHSIVFVDELPRNPGGKVLKYVLRKEN
ncbi:MAG: FadD3 family acyl-CoA ligase [Mycobacteriaceae bacterium]